jgi:hypothetical protein
VGQVVDFPAHPSDFFVDLVYPAVIVGLLGYSLIGFGHGSRGETLELLVKRLLFFP